MTTPQHIYQLIGQMFMVGFHGHTAPDYLLDWLRAGRVGGVILFARNIDTPQQVADLTRTLHEAAAYPLLISIDQEGGTVARLRKGFSESPGALALAGSQGDPSAATQGASAVLGREMAALGINWTYAPVVDITHNTANPTVGTRSFGTDPETVGELAAAAVRGFQGAGVAACAKHFPGLGDTAVDTHLALPTLDTPTDQLRTVDLVPYRTALGADVASIMTTHTIYTDLDPDHPATLSDVVIPRLLRGELSYDGVVTTDCMEMKAIDDNYGVLNSVTRAAHASVDIILFSHTPEKQEAAYEALVKYVEVGALDWNVIGEANRRIAAMKARFPVQTPNPTKVYTTANQETVKQLARNTITLVRDAGALPLSGPVRLVEFTPFVDSEVQENADDSTLAHALKAVSPDLTVQLLPAVPGAADIAALPEQIAETLVIATRNAHRIPSQAEAVAALTEHAAPVVLVALRNPYDAHLLDGCTVLVSGGDSRPSLTAVADALMGAFTPQGRIEVGE